MSSPNENKDASPKAAKDNAFQHCKTIASLPTETVLEDIRQGKNPATVAVANLKSEQMAYRNRLVEGGLVPIVLSLLKRCEGETVADIIGERGDGEKYIDSPGVWVALLANVVTTDINARNTNRSTFHSGCANCMEIAESVEPIIKCMRDDKTREFFKSKEDWAVSYSFVQALLVNVVMVNNNALDVLLQYDGFLEMLVQCLFWESHRPDIMGDEHCEKRMMPRRSMIRVTAIRILYLTFLKICKQVGPEKQENRMVNDMTDEEKKQLYKIGVTPIVSEAYDPGCAVPFALGLVQLVKSSAAWDDLDTQSKKILYFMLGELGVSECVDEAVIKGVVSLGEDFASDLVDAKELPRVVYRMLNVSISGGSHPQFEPVDARYSAAIDAGLFPMCFKLLLLFGDELGGLVCDTLGCILQGATSVAFHPRTSKAIANVRSQTQTAFRNPELASLRGNEKCGNVLRMLSFFCREFDAPSAGVDEVDGAVSCRNCSKVLEKDVIKRCGGCKKAVYCSRDCQTIDWKERHKRECKLMQGSSGNKIVNIGLDGISKRDEEKMANQADKLMAAASEMFYQHTDFLLKWCVVNEVDALDVVPIMNFCNAPPSFDLIEAADFLRNNPCQMRPGERLHESAKDIMAKHRAKGGITGVTLLVPAGCADKSKMAALLNEFPGENLIWGSWAAAQKGVKERMVQEGWSEGLPYPIGGFD